MAASMAAVDSVGIESSHEQSNTGLTLVPPEVSSTSPQLTLSSNPLPASYGQNNRKIEATGLAICPQSHDDATSQQVLDTAPRTGVSLAASLTGVLNPQARSTTAVSKHKIAEVQTSDTNSKDNSDFLAHKLAALSSSQIHDTEIEKSTARTSLKSPCYFHQRFDDAVNIERVLDEVVSDEWMSHSRLMQTATGVREVSKHLQRRSIKLAVKNVMIVTKARDNSLVYLTRELAEWLLSTPRYGSDLGVNVYVDAKLRLSKRFDTPGLLEKNPRFEHMLKYWTPDLCWSHPEKFDLVITLGGDGTVLFTSWLFQRVVPPILSFSLGSLGFLTNFEFSKYKDHLNQIMGDVGMRVNLRMRFTCTVYRSNPRDWSKTTPAEEVERFEVVNELVIDRGPSPYVSNLEGSTAYSLSAGGSLIHPSIPAILLTPICPHTLSFRPMVLSDTLLLRVAVPRHSRSSAYCSFDGKGRIELQRGDYVTVEASQYPFPTVVSQSGEWFQSVRRTLRWNVRGAVQKGWNGREDCPNSEVNTLALNADRAFDSGHYEEDNYDEQDPDWDIDTDTNADLGPGVDSGLGQSECGDSPNTGTSSPIHRVMSLLNI
ncbi:NAD kinase 2 [Nannizzia gypsea CBS 118893]|uniref:NAD kinase 2 n=1 Tax=Arthroderma gypseum (strain ATCC MYA-4604 / CBS 118893) TaxID=535722 RepID=E5R1M0_ARTGP|nr:NAD kinase 2 [Nannizzia gypsea CBS 118893]EFQ97718.1 NAD kinase 2 [Nannizzia gypsea CBS 118893]